MFAGSRNPPVLPYASPCRLSDVKVIPSRSNIPPLEKVGNTENIFNSSQKDFEAKETYLYLRRWNPYHCSRSWWHKLDTRD